MKGSLRARFSFVLVLILILAACAVPKPAVPPTAAPPAVVSPPPITKSIVGAWKGSSPDGQIELTFQKNGAVTLVSGGESNRGTFTADLSASPGTLDIAGDWLEDKKISTIIELVDNDHLRIENNQPGEKRPAAFSGSAALLTRQQ